MAGPARGGSAALTASSSQRWMEAAESKMERSVSVCGGVEGGGREAGVSERINGSHYMVLTVWPGHGVMDVQWQVMVLCSLRLSKRR